LNCQRETKDFGTPSQFQSVTGAALPSLHTELSGQKGIEPLKAMSREEWEKKQK
jgi:hypothetical protein